MKKILVSLFLGLLAFGQSFAQTDNLVENINAIVSQSLLDKKFNAKIELLVNTSDEHAHSPGYAIFDFKTQTCQFKLNQQALKDSIFTDRLFKFFIYHELSHCHFFSNPFVIANFKELNLAQNKILNDIVFLDILIQTDKRLNAYNVYHEAYADVRAMALLLAEGYTPEDFKSLKALRLDDFLDGHHNTASGFAAVFKEDWKHSSKKEFEDNVARIAMNITLDNFFGDFYRKYEGSDDALFGVFKSNIYAMVSAYYYNFNVDQEFHKERFGMLLENNTIIDQYPLWKFVERNLLVTPKQKNAQNFFPKMIEELYGFNDEKTMQLQMHEMENFIKIKLNKNH